jgi:hypothetical protein
MKIGLSSVGTNIWHLVKEEVPVLQTLPGMRAPERVIAKALCGVRLYHISPWPGSLQEDSCFRCQAIAKKLLAQFIPC